VDALYATLPEMKCQGLCSDSCGPVGMSIRERARIIERARKPITCGAYASCSLLTDDRKCSVYDIRPMICRLWGLVASMPCPYGCRPEGGLLPDSEGARLLVAADGIGGSDMGEQLYKMAAQALEAMSQAELEAKASAIFRSSRPTLAGREYSLAPTVLEHRRQSEKPR
jgi:hypothetical protein